MYRTLTGPLFQTQFGLCRRGRRPRGQTTFLGRAGPPPRRGLLGGNLKATPKRVGWSLSRVALGTKHSPKNGTLTAAISDNNNCLALYTVFSSGLQYQLPESEVNTFCARVRTLRNPEKFLLIFLKVLIASYNSFKYLQWT